MNKLKPLFMCLCVIGLSACVPPKDHNSGIETIERKGLVREFCIDGVAHIKLVGDTALTVKYAKGSLLPQRCQ
jgi:hypothetical protein